MILEVFSYVNDSVILCWNIQVKCEACWCSHLHIQIGAFGFV